ncbi:MAG TPA: hypothetical protein VKA10_02460 [Prolixibacteraceae bacterium]|nr:hypothetical protein [Prolixibacteraceae bacterium]
MKHYLVFLILLAVTSLLWGQEETVVLQDEPIEFEADGFYIKKVVDARNDRANIGFVQKGLIKKKKVDAHLKYGVETSVYSYLKENFEQEKGGVPIVIYITELKISETKSLPIAGRAEIEMVFYREREGSIAKLFTSESYVEKPAVNVTATHEERIREVIVSCLESFNGSDWKTVDPVYFKEKQN